MINVVEKKAYEFTVYLGRRMLKRISVGIESPDKFSPCAFKAFIDFAQSPTKCVGPGVWEFDSKIICK